MIGCAVGVAAGMLLWRRATRHRLPAAQAAALEAARRLIAVSYGAPAPAPERLHRARRELRGALVNLRAVHRDALGDARPRDADADRRWPTTVAVQRLAYLALSPLRDVAIAPDRLARLDAAVATLAADVRSGAPSPGARLPSLDELPHTSAQLAELRRELEGLQAG